MKTQPLSLRIGLGTRKRIQERPLSTFCNGLSLFLVGHLEQFAHIRQFSELADIYFKIFFVLAAVLFILVKTFDYTTHSHLVR